MTKVPHTINGRLCGMFYHFDDGKGLYLAHCKPRDVHRKKDAWCIDVSVLNEARERGISVVGVVCGTAKSKNFWVTDLEDFFESRHSFSHWDEMQQRGLPRGRFKLNPLAREGYVSKSVKLR